MTNDVKKYKIKFVNKIYNFEIRFADIFTLRE